MSDTSGSDEVPIVGEGAADGTSSVTNHASSAPDMQQALIAVLQSIEQEPSTDKTHANFAVEFGAALAEELLIDAGSATGESDVVQEAGSEANAMSSESELVPTGANAPASSPDISASVGFGITSVDELLIDAGSLEGIVSSDASDNAAPGNQGAMLPLEDEGPAQISFDPLAIKVLFGEDDSSS